MIRYATPIAVLLILAPVVASAQPVPEAPITADRIEAAINDAVTFLRALQQPDGSIHGGYQPDGETALAALAMLATGGNPASDDQLRKALDWLAARESDNTYVRGIRANVWEYALRKVPYDKRIRELLKKDFEWLLAALGDREGWRYSMSSRDWDNSCTQYGVLGIWAAARAGFDPGEAFWQTMSKHFRDCQNSDGGWSYTRGGSTPNMATAGLASMFLVFDTYHGRTCYTRTHPRTFTEGEAAEVLASINRGMNWLGSAQANKDDGYYLYGIERTGVASGRKTIGGEDWFARGAQSVLRAQRPDGSIPMGQWGGVVCNTAFCTLFMVYGGAPVAIEKLEYFSGDWQLNRTESDAFRLAMSLLFYVTDLGNLKGKFASILPDTPPATSREETLRVARVSHTQSEEHPRDWDAAAMCWQVFAPYAEHITGCKFEEVTPRWLGQDDLEGIRLLHLTGRTTLRLSDSERAALKEFAEQGGMVLVDAYAGSLEFASSARKELEAIFGTLQPLPANHLLAEGRFAGGEDLNRGARLKLPARQRLRSRGEDPSGQKLLVARVRNRPVVIYSEFDLSAAMAGIENFRSLGYKPGGARMIVGNLLAYVMAD